MGNTQLPSSMEVLECPHCRRDNYFTKEEEGRFRVYQCQQCHRPFTKNNNMEDILWILIDLRDRIQDLEKSADVLSSIVEDI